MADIVLTTCNATWSHPSFGLRCLRANLGGLRSRSEIVEFDLRRTPAEMADRLLARSPRVLGIGMYIWNAALITSLLRELRGRAADAAFVIGGPEISHETERQEAAELADFVVRGEGETAFAELCGLLLEGGRPAGRLTDAPRPDLARLSLPYDEYADGDLAHRVTYVETTRGCPFGCEYCLSCLDRTVREWPLEAALEAFGRLLARGARRFKFVDRTFNLDLDRSRRVLAFFRDRLCPGLTLHFELVPDRLPPALREAMAVFPPGILRFEVGVQTFDAAVAARVGRAQDMGRTEDTLRFLRAHGAVVHADLLAGLPGGDMAGLARDFDRLLALGPQEIQLGILKRLRGTPLPRHDAEWGMRYNPQPPYEIMESRRIPRAHMDRIKRMARYWEIFVNREPFRASAPLIWADAPSPFDAFMAFADWLHERAGRTYALPVERRARWLMDFLTTERRMEPGRVRAALARDWGRLGARHPPPFLRI